MKLYGGASSTRSADYNGTSFFRKKWFKVVILTIAIAGTLTMGAAAWWKLNIKPPELPSEEIEIPVEVLLPDTDLNTTARPVQPGEEETPVVNVRKTGVFTFLLAGLNEEEGCTDVLMIGTLDTINETFNFVSIPRDTVVNVKRNVKKINGAYSAGRLMNVEDKDAGGLAELKAEVKTVIGFSPDFVALVNMRGFKRLVQTLGGVDFYVPHDMYHYLGQDSNGNDEYINLKEGQRKLNGDEALQLVRYRGYKGRDDYGRIDMSHQFLVAMGKQILSLGNVFKLNEFIDIARENLKTDISATSMIWFATMIMEYGTDCLNFYTLPSEPIYANNGWYVNALEEEILVMVNEKLNPYTREITSDDLDILTY